MTRTVWLTISFGILFLVGTIGCTAQQAAAIPAPSASQGPSEPVTSAPPTVDNTAAYDPAANPPPMPVVSHSYSGVGAN